MFTGIRKRRGGLLIEAVLSGFIAAVVIVGLLRLYNFSRQMSDDTREQLVAVNVLDNIMAYFEGYFMDPVLDTGSGLPLDPFDNSELAANGAEKHPTIDSLDGMIPANKVDAVNDHPFRDDLSAQLVNLSAWYKIDLNQPAAPASPYRDVLVRAGINWTDSRGVLRSREIVSTFSSERW